MRVSENSFLFQVTCRRPSNCPPALCPTLMHALPAVLRSSPHLWKDPDTFRPERFTGETCSDLGRTAVLLCCRGGHAHASASGCAGWACVMLVMSLSFETCPSTRDAERFENPAFGGKWAGYNPAAQGSSLYPNEVSSDFAFLPFGELLSWFQQPRFGQVLQTKQLAFCRLKCWAALVCPTALFAGWP